MTRTSPHFLNWCAREKQEPVNVRRLLRLARRAVDEGTRWCNGHSERDAYERTMDSFERAADAMGYKTDWPGLWPVLKDATGHDVYLPEGDTQ